MALRKLTCQVDCCCRNREIAAAMKNSLEAEASKLLIFTTIPGRDGGIRTRDPLHPMQVRYQAALRPD